MRVEMRVFNKKVSRVTVPAAVTRLTFLFGWVTAPLNENIYYYLSVIIIMISLLLLMNSVIRSGVSVPWLNCARSYSC